VADYFGHYCRDAPGQELLTGFALGARSRKPVKVGALLDAPLLDSILSM
jgi:hypothetical protein